MYVLKNNEYCKSTLNITCTLYLIICINVTIQSTYVCMYNTYIHTQYKKYKIGF